MDNFNSKLQFMPRFIKKIGSKFGIYMENSSSKRNFWQIHLVYLPKPGPISKPGISASASILVW